jgi:integrase
MARPTKPYRFNGKTFDGLYLRPDGRWRVTKTGDVFTEHDPAEAVKRFRKLTGNSVDVLRQETLDYMDRTRKADICQAVDIDRYFDANRDAIWKKVADEIRNRPLWIATQTGIEQIGYLVDLKKPEVLPSLDEIENIWQTKSTCSFAQMRKVRRAWKDFRATTEIESLRSITPQTVIAYRDEVGRRSISGKQQSHLFTGIRRMISFAKSRAIAVEAMSRALGNLDLLRGQRTPTSLNPMPVSVEDWRKLYAASEGDNRAMVLLMLNCALYIGEVIRLQWSDFQSGCLVSRRLKTGNCIRVSALWPETIEAIGGIKRQGEFLFYNYRAEPLKVCGAQRRFWNLADKAQIDVTASHLRDGAFTAAVENNVTENLVNIYVGHSSGLKDNYVLANPAMVKPATDSVYRKYFPAA